MTRENALFEGERLIYAFTHTTFGWAVAAMGPKGVAAILIGSDRDALLAELRESLPGATLVEDQEAMMSTMDEIAFMLASPTKGGRFELDLRGSPLELAVWNALRRTAGGETITYGALARRLETPATPQEVGAACAANRIAVAIPCHRVVKADGSISGYRWGVHRKRRLIDMEGAA